MIEVVQSGQKDADLATGAALGQLVCRRGGGLTVMKHGSGLLRMMLSMQ